MKLTNKLREETLIKAADKFVEKDVQALKARALEIGTEIYNKYLASSRKKVEEVVEQGTIPADWFRWSETVFVEVNGVEFIDLICKAHGVTYRSEIPRYTKEVQRVDQRVLKSLNHLPCPRHPDSLHGQELVKVADSVTIKKVEQFANDIAKLNEQMITFCQEVSAVLYTANTYKHLEELAPELAKLYPTPAPKSSGQLIPVETLNVVNAKLAQLGTAGLI